MAIKTRIIFEIVTKKKKSNNQQINVKNKNERTIVTRETTLKYVPGL